MVWTMPVVINDILRVTMAMTIIAVFMLIVCMRMVMAVLFSLHVFIVFSMIIITTVMSSIAV